MHAGRPNLLASGFVAIVQDADCATAAIAIARDENGVCEELASFGTIESGAVTRTLTVGTARNRTVEVRVAPLPDIESQATLNAVTMLLGTIHDLERAQAEREERLTLWPIDELPFEGDDSVIAGHMRELMSFARKVARTNVTVLITGESGTGKEILARAIHGFSARAKKPFVPFNCTAVPREMLESQLFGHRRGAFTGADRDNPGLIRAAKDGTLFLDEIGELGLDLQPKLLRFLESGEISPLGEPSPFNVDVRIVAATNAQPRAARRGRPVPRGPVLPPERDPPADPAAARTPRRNSRRSSTTSSRRPQASSARAASASPKKPWSTCCSTRGRATSASCKTNCAAWSRSPTPTRP